MTFPPQCRTNSQLEVLIPVSAEPEITSFPFSSPALPYDPAPEVRDLMAKCPVNKVRMPDDAPAWLITGFREVREAVTDQRYSRALVFAPGRQLYSVDVALAGGITAMDPPEHSRFRKLVAGAFTGRRIEALRPSVIEIVNELIDAMLAGPRPADLVSSFAFILPASVICLLLGVPVTDADRFAGLVGELAGDASRSPERMFEAYTALVGYMSELIAKRREAPEDDLISVLIDARDSKGRLSEEELVQFCITLLGAGFETTANAIGLSFVALCQHPGELDRLRADPGLIPGAVEELLRYVNIFGTGFQALPRVTREEVCLGGVTIGAGETVLSAFSAANRDPAEFEDPDRLDVGREPKSHLAFGGGAHHCLGAQLARMELQEAFRGLLTRLPGLRMAVSVPDLEFREGQALTTMRELPVTWDD